MALPENRGGIVGEGHRILAEIYIRAYNDIPRATALYEKVLAHPDTMPNDQTMVYRDYARMLLDQVNDPEAAVAMAKRGLAQMNRLDKHEWQWLRTLRELGRKRTGEYDRTMLKYIVFDDIPLSLRDYLREKNPGGEQE